MDPINNPAPAPVPTPTPTPPTPAPTPAPEPVVPPVAPVVPEPVAPVSTPEPVVPAPNPVVNGAAPVNPVYQPTGNGVKATDPIMMPEPAPEPDPIEEELKAPMKAADPVPGSIGSAVSGTPNAGATPSVAFNDPATMQNTTDPAAAGQMAPAPKKTNKTTLTVLIAVAAVIVVALAVVLGMQLMGGGNGSDPGSGSSSGDASEVEPTPEEVLESKTLSCTRAMTEDDLAIYDNAVSGTIKIEAEFNAKGNLESISLKRTVTTSDETSSEAPVKDEYMTEVDDFDGSEVTFYKLPVDEDGDTVLSFDEIESNYKDLDYTCKTL